MEETGSESFWLHNCTMLIRCLVTMSKWFLMTFAICLFLPPPQIPVISYKFFWHYFLIHFRDRTKEERKVKNWEQSCSLFDILCKPGLWYVSLYAWQDKSAFVWSRFSTSWLGLVLNKFTLYQYWPTLNCQVPNCLEFLALSIQI